MPGRQRIPRPPGVRAGGLAPWAGLPLKRRRGIGVERVRAALRKPRLGDLGQESAIAPVPRQRRAGTQSAVLVPLFEEDGETHVILTRRAAGLRSHSGEIAFPGGVVEPGEGACHASLREAEEEIGLSAGDVAVIAELRPLATIIGSRDIRPFVGVLSGRPPLSPSPAEVEIAFDVRICDLLSDEVWREERWDLPGRPDVPFFFYELDEDTIWGATARVLTDLLERVTGPDRH